MIKFDRSIQLFRLALLAVFLSSVNTAFSSDTTAHQIQTPPEKSGEMFFPSDQPMTDVEQAMNRARDRDQLVLVILGANWCHDSRALAARIYEEPLRKLIEQHYQVVFVDVAYLDKGRDVINSIGPPVFYATPTVLIVDPVSGALVNASNRHQWGDASTISMEESFEYFQLMANADLANLREPDPLPESVQGIMSEIDTFERAQANRLYDAYAVLGPLLSAYKAGEKPKNFESTWNEVRGFRMSVARDVDRLRSEAMELALPNNGEIVLEYPEYPAFSWEVQE